MKLTFASLFWPSTRLPFVLVDERSLPRHASALQRRKGAAGLKPERRRPPSPYGRAAHSHPPPERESSLHRRHGGRSFERKRRADEPKARKLHRSDWAFGARPRFLRNPCGCDVLTANTLSAF